MKNRLLMLATLALSWIALVVLTTSSQQVYTGPSGATVGGGGGGGGGSPLGGVNSQTANYTAVAGDAGKLIVFNAVASITLTLPNPPPSPTWVVGVLNLCNGNCPVTVSRNGLNINGATSNPLVYTNSTVSIFTDGTNYFTAQPFNLGLYSTASINGFGTVNNGSFTINAINAAQIFAAGINSGNLTIGGGSAVAIGGGSRFKLVDQGSCTMAAGVCSAQALGSTYTAAPVCFASVTTAAGTRGFVGAPSTTTTVTPTSSSGTETSTVSWGCFGN